MQLHINLHPQRDVALIQVLQAIPSGERAGQIREALTERFVRQSDIAQAIHRLADVLENQAASFIASVEADKTKPLNQPDPRARHAAMGLFKKFGALEDD